MGQSPALAPPVPSAARLPYWEHQVRQHHALVVQGLWLAAASDHWERAALLQVAVAPGVAVDFTSSVQRK